MWPGAAFIPVKEGPLAVLAEILSFADLVVVACCGIIVKNQTSKNIWHSPYDAKRLFLKLNDIKRLIAFTISSKRNVRHYNSQRSADLLSSSLLPVPHFVGF
ncbi:hypothetical protein MKMG_01571 [Methanogenium sp. MK-MG]|nr:hypothetical protein MKMG_01571 [Methanogenium sp. MK-MG]